jgi:hypothetical protein
MAALFPVKKLFLFLFVNNIALKNVTCNWDWHHHLAAWVINLTVGYARVYQDGNKAYPKKY